MRKSSIIKRAPSNNTNSNQINSKIVERKHAQSEKSPITTSLGAGRSVE